jgi:Domain of unknown function (DUF4177)
MLPGTMTKWDYLVLSLPITADRATIQAALNEHGRAGWELVSAVSVTPAGDQALHLCFKRPTAA